MRGFAPDVPAPGSLEALRVVMTERMYRELPARIAMWEERIKAAQDHVEHMKALLVEREGAS